MTNNTNFDRIKFKSYYNDAVIDILTLKNECNCANEDIKKTTVYDIDFINFVINNYDVVSNNNFIYIKVNKDNIDVQKLRDIGYSDELINEVLNPEIEGTTYYMPK